MNYNNIKINNLRIYLEMVKDGLLRTIIKYKNRKEPLEFEYAINKKNNKNRISNSIIFYYQNINIVLF